MEINRILGIVRSGVGDIGAPPTNIEPADKINPYIKVIEYGLASYLIPRNDIIYIETKSQLIIFHTIDDEFSTNVPLISLMDELGPSFRRCHKSYIVNVDYVESYSEKTIKLKNNDHIIPIGRAYKKEFLHWI